MKSLSFLLALTIAIAAFAQEKSVSNVSKISDGSQKGLYVGMDYMNITDLHMKFTINSSNESYSNTSGMHLGMAGMTIGYHQAPEVGVGFAAGVRLLETFNRSEFGENKLDIVMPEGNITLAANQYFSGYAGLNVSVWSGSSVWQKFKSQLGGQAGVGVRFSKNLAMNAGYTIMNQKVSSHDNGEDSVLEIQASGFSSNLIYTF